MIKVFMTCEGIAYRKEVTCKDTKDDNNSFRIIKLEVIQVIILVFYFI